MGYRSGAFRFMTNTCTRRQANASIFKQERGGNTILSSLQCFSPIKKVEVVEATVST